MKRKLRVFAKIFILALILWQLGQQQALSQTGTTEGKEFAFGFLINGSSDNPFNLSVHVSAGMNTEGEVSIPSEGFEFPFNLNAGESITIPIPNRFRPKKVGERESLAIHVNASEDVSVYAYNELPDSGDAAMILPIQSLSDEYIIHSYNNDFFQESITQNQVLLVGVEDTTIYEFIPSVDLFDLEENLLHDSGTRIRDTLYRGEQIAYHAVSNFSGSTVRTLNSSEANTCVPLSVFVGHVATQVDACLSSDHLFSQLYAPADWGKEYLIVPFATRFGGDVVQIMAKQNNTNVQIGTNSSVVLNRGERHSLLVPNTTLISANKGISMMQLSRGKQCDNTERGDELADPFMLMLSPANQIIREVTFPVMANQSTEKYFVQMVVPADDLEVTLDDVDISGFFEVYAADPRYAYATQAIAKGTKKLKSKHGVVAHVYAFGDSESYGMAVGGNLGEFEVVVQDEQQGLLVGESVSICEDAQLQLRVDAEFPTLKDIYSQYQWVLSNGVVLTGEQVTYEFDSAGLYTLEMIAIKDQSPCSQLIVSKEINVVENALDKIVGPASVCPNAQDITYQVEGAESNYTYRWLISGGTFDGASEGETVNVDWAIADPDAQIAVYSISPQGCLSDTVTFDIVLNEVLMPSAPDGPVALCAEDINSIRYSTAQSTGSSYVWEAIGGEVIADQGTATVLVNWSGTGTHQLRFVESTTVNALCGGVSEDLEVTVYEPLSVNIETTETSCFGKEDGRATLSVNGGLGPYSVQWDTGEERFEVDGKSAGRYQAKVRDALACEIVVNVDISEPEELNAIALPQDAVCNGERGFVQLQVNGGTAPYSFLWSDGLTSDQAMRTALGQGNYQLEVIDARDCRVPVTFSIQEPSALTAEVDIKPACPEASDGIIDIDVDGGVAPYTLFWDQNDQSSEEEIKGLAAGNYDIKVIDASGCELQVNAVVDNLSPILTMPSAFTPNDDGVNDTYGVVYNCLLKVRLSIYNKWGQLMFNTDQIDESWDGYYQGELAPVGTYTYQLTYQTIFNGSLINEVLTGRFHLIK